MPTLYIRPKDQSDAAWEPIDDDDDPNTVAYSIYDLWEQGIYEVCIDDTDHEISNTPTEIRPCPRP